MESPALPQQLSLLWDRRTQHPAGKVCEPRAQHCVCVWFGGGGSAVQSLSCVRLFATPRTVAGQASLSFTISRSLLKLMSVESVIPSNHLILCRPVLLLPSIFPSIRVFSDESALRIRWPEYWSFSFGISPSTELVCCGLF